MNFSQTELVNAMHLLSTRLPQFPEQRNQVFRMLRIVTERLNSYLNESLKTFSINENLQFSLIAVYIGPNSETLPSRLGDLMDLTRTSVTRLSDDMVERGWVRRYINQKDRRQIVLKLTPSGETFIHEIWPQIARQSDQAWEDFTKEDYDTLQHLLGKLLNRLDN